MSHYTVIVWYDISGPDSDGREAFREYIKNDLQGGSVGDSAFLIGGSSPAAEIHKLLLKTLGRSLRQGEWVAAANVSDIELEKG